MYVVQCQNKIVGIGSIGPCLGSLTESSFYNIYVLPEYQGKDIGKLIIKTLEKDEYYKRANRIEILYSITGMEFYRRMGYGFKKLGYIVDDGGEYKMEKFPKVSYDNTNPNQYNMRPYIDNKYHNYKEFIFQTIKKAYKKYIEQYFGILNEYDQIKYFKNITNSIVVNEAWIIQLNGVDIGFFNGKALEDGSYKIENICIIPEYENKGIETRVLKDIMWLHEG